MRERERERERDRKTDREEERERLISQYFSPRELIPRGEDAVGRGEAIID